MISKFAIVTILLLIISFFSSGCIPPQPRLEGKVDGPVDPSLIKCDENPEIVDGDLKTLSLIAKPRDMKEIPDHPFTIIKFRKPVYVTFIEVYTKDNLANLNISFANSDTESKVIRWDGVGSSFNVEKEQKKRIVIRGKINMMKLTASWIKDNSQGNRNIGTINVKGPEIYEIKFCTNQPNGGK